MRKYFVGFVFLLVFGFSVHGAGLSEAQIQAIMGLLSTFNVDTSIITNVETSLRGGTPTTRLPLDSGEVCPAIARVCQNGTTPMLGPGCSQRCPEDGNVYTTSTHPILPACPIPSRPLSQGSRGDDVIALQSFLSQEANVDYSAGVTGYFGPQTLEAVQRLQVSEGIVTSGSPETTGFGALGPRTREAIMRRCENWAPPIQPVPMEIPFSASPTHGIAPLRVSFSYPLVGGAVQEEQYRIDFGDGTTGKMELGCGNVGSNADACPRSLTASHTYTSSGAYTAKLLLSGNPACYYSDPPCLMPANLDKVVGTVTIKVE